MTVCMLPDGMYTTLCPYTSGSLVFGTMSSEEWRWNINHSFNGQRRECYKGVKRRRKRKKAMKNEDTK